MLGKIRNIVIAASIMVGGVGGIAATAAPAMAATCTASGDTNHTPNVCGPYTDPNILGSGSSGNTQVNNDVWSPPPGFTNATCQTGAATPCQTVTASDAEHWSVTGNFPNEGGAVQSYPDTQQVYTLAGSSAHPNGVPDPITNYSPLYSSFTNTPPDSSNSYDIGYDIWGGSTSAADNNWADEIMIWTGQSNRAGCGGSAPTLTGIQFGGTGGVPVQSWNLYNYGSERIWCNPSLQENSGSVDVYAMLHYLMAPNYTGAGSLPADFGLNSIEYGIEYCYTNGTFATYSLSQFGISKTGSGGGSGQSAPLASSAAASSVTQTGAVLNGSVNPEGAATTYQFDYGTSTSYGSSVPVPAGSAGSGTSPVSETASLTGLSPGATYHYRIEATNSAGTAYGADETFTTTSANGGSSDTVTATATNGAGSTILKVFNVDGGAPGGAVITSGGYASPSFGLTPKASGSLLLQSVFNAQDATAVTPAANNAKDDSGVSGSNLAYEDGHYTGTVTAGSSVTLGGTDSNQWNAWSGYEVEPAVTGVPPTLDASTPAAVVGSTSSATTPSFTPTPGSELVAIVQGNGSAPQTFSVSDANGLTWSQVGTTYSSAYEGSEAVYVATVPGSGGGGSQSAPSATTGAATGITTSAANLNGSVNPNGAETTYQMDYGTTTSYGSSVPVPASDIGSGTSALNETQAVSGLAASTTYHYRIEATNSAGTTFGSDQSFTTAAVPQSPSVTTGAASGVTSSAAVLNGSVNPNNQSTTYQFDYGTSTSYGSTIPVGGASAGSGSSAMAESANLSSLSPSTTYHYRIEATNPTGTSFGADQSFTTSAVSTGEAYDSTGPSSSGAKVANASSLSWNHIVGSGANRMLLAEVAVGTSNDVGCSLTLTDNGVAMGKLAIVHDNNQHSGYFDVFSLANPSQGTNTLSATVTGCGGGTPLELTGGSESFTGVSQTSSYGTVVTAYGSGATATASTVGSYTGDMMAGFAANGSPIYAPASPVTSRFIANEDGNSGAGNSAGASVATPGNGSGVTFSWPVSSDWWGAVIVPLHHA